MARSGCGLTAAVLVFSAGLACGPGAAAQGEAGRLDTVLREMDAASAKFQSAQADVRKDVYTKVVDDHEIQTGVIYFLRTASGTQMGMKMTTPPEQVVEYKEGTVRLFNPGMNHVDEVSSTGANKSRIETFLTLGFGGSGRDLERAWTITDQGPEQMSDGTKSVPVERLDLVSKDPEARKNIAHVTIWVDAARDVSLEQKFFMPSGDTQTAFYSNIRLNQKVDVGQFAIKCKGKCS